MTPLCFEQFAFLLSSVLCFSILVLESHVSEKCLTWLPEFLSDGGLPVWMAALSRQRESLFKEVSVGKVMTDVFG